MEPDLTNHPADHLGVEESPAGVLHQMPAIGDLNGMRQGSRHRLSLPTAAVTGDRMDNRLVPEPSLGCCWLPVGKQDDRPATFEVADDRAVAVIASPREVIDTDHAQ